MGNRHLSDERLIEVCTEGALPLAEEQHLVGCPECDARRRDLAELLADCTAAAAADADEAFPADRLARQQARIQHRIEQGGRPGRLISFPAAYAGEPSLMRARPSTRWIAVAAAAGLVIGLLAGQIVKSPERSVPTRQAVTRPAVPAPTLRAVATTMSDEEFLVHIDNAVQRSGGSALGPLDELTPRVWEVAAR